MTVPVTLGVFAKWPAPGHAKTRLIPLLGAEGAARAAMALLKRSLHWIDECPGHVNAVLWTDGGIPSDWVALLSTLQTPSRWQVQTQVAGHLGVRMQAAMALQFAQMGDQGHSLLMGTDTPTLGYAHVAVVCDGLQAHDAVFIPALDGGYVMVGMRRLCEPAFDALEWGSERVAQQTRWALDSSGFSQQWLGAEPDLDEPADYEAAVQAGWLSR